MRFGSENLVSGDAALQITDHFIKALFDFAIDLLGCTCSYELPIINAPGDGPVRAC